MFIFSSIKTAFLSFFFFFLVILFKGFLWCLEKSYWLLDHFSHSFRCFLVPRWKHHSCCSGIHYWLLSLDYQSPKQKGLNPGTPFPLCWGLKLLSLQLKEVPVACMWPESGAIRSYDCFLWAIFSSAPFFSFCIIFQLFSRSPRSWRPVCFPASLCCCYFCSGHLV